MNRILTAITTVALLSGSAAFAQDVKNVNDDLFAGTKIFEKNATSVTEVNQGPDQLGMVGGSHASKARGMYLNLVMTYEYDQPGMYNMADVDKFREKLNTGDWHCSVHERNLKNGESTDVCEKARTDGMRESAIITVEKKELTFIHQIRKEGDGGHSDASMMAFPGGANMEAMLAMNEARFAGVQARMQAQMATGGLRALGPLMAFPNEGNMPSTLYLDSGNGAAPGKEHWRTRTIPSPPASPAAIPSPAAPEAAPAPAPAPVQ